MKTETLTISGIPAVLWGTQSDNLYIAVHGKHGNKEEAETLAEKSETTQETTGKPSPSSQTAWAHISA